MGRGRGRLPVAAAIPVRLRRVASWARRATSRAGVVSGAAAGGGVRARGCLERGDGCGGFDGGDLLLLLGLLGDAELFFHLSAELVGGAAELGHELAELAGEHGQLLRTEEEQGEEEDDGAILKAGHMCVP